MQMRLHPAASLLLWALSAPGSQGSSVRLMPPTAITNGVAHVEATGPAGVSQVLELSTDLVHWVGLDVTRMTGGAAAWDLSAGEGVFHAYRLREAQPSEVPSPLSMKTVVNTDFVHTESVSREGATLGFTDDNGVGYQLVIPPDALFALEDITLSVVGSVTGWPLKGGFQAGVRIEPDGVLLMMPATLTLTLPTAAGSAVGLAWHDLGDDLHAHPARVDGVQVSLPVASLGGYGVATVGSGDLALLTAHPPATLAEQVDHGMELGLLAPPVAAAALAEVSPASLSPALVDRLTATYHNSIYPNLTTAGDDDALLSSALAQYGLWKLGLTLEFSAADLAVLQPLFDQAEETAAQAILNAINRASARCERHEIEVLGRLVRFGELMEVGPWSSRFTPADLQLFRQKVKNCATFDLELNAVVTDTDPLGHGQSTVHHHWTIEFKDEALTQPTGGGTEPMDAEYQSDKPPCVVASIGPSPGGMQIPELNLLPNARALRNLRTRPSARTMSVICNPFVGAPRENITIICPPAPLQIPLKGFWTVGVAESYLDRLVHTRLGDAYRIANWNDGADDLLGQRDDTFRVVADGQLVLDVKVHWGLRHTPIPFH